MLFKIILILEFCLGWAHIFLHIVYAFPRIACYGTRCFRHIHIDVSLMFGSSNLTAWLWSFVDISLHQTKFDRMCVIKREEVTIYVIRRDINLTSRHLLIQLIWLNLVNLSLLCRRHDVIHSYFIMNNITSYHCKFNRTIIF